MDIQGLKNRRLFERIPCTLLGDYANSNHKSVGTKCYDISTTGAGLFLFERLAKGFEMQLNLVTKKISTLSLAGKVCWCRKEADGYRAGIAFNKSLNLPLEALA